MVTNYEGVDYMYKYNADKEVWKEVSGYDGRYQVSNHGRVKRARWEITRKDGVKTTYKEKVLSSPNSTDGYPSLGLMKGKKRHSYKVHRLVAMEFVPNPNGYVEVNHIDENKENNHSSNLEWCTRKHNMNHGTVQKRAHSHPNAIKKLEESKRPIVAINIETGQEIHFESFNEASRSGFNRRNIHAAITGSDKSHRGHVWCRLEDYSEEKKKELIDALNLKMPRQKDGNNNIIKTFESLELAGKAVGTHPSNISRACHSGKKAGGFYWEY